MEESKNAADAIALNDKNAIDMKEVPLHQYFKKLDKLGFEDQINKNENIENAFDEEEREMIMPVVSPQDWNNEYIRVMKYIDKDLDVKGNVHEANKNISKKKFIRRISDVTYIDEFMEKIENIISYFKVVTDFINNGGK
jgi:protein associated with RNAse G/E